MDIPLNFHIVYFGEKRLYLGEIFFNTVFINPGIFVVIKIFSYLENYGDC